MEHWNFSSTFCNSHPHNIHPPSNPVLTDDHDWSVVCPLPPPLDHVHQLDQGVGGGGHLVALGPAHQLEQLACLARSLNSCHQLCQRHDLLVDLENPGPEVDVLY